ncbi:MAG: hypothetical protein EBT92_19640, partial [Planctomycetes bacterium]|nr:hypothetical protein [Planctomycetota bacterium]
AGVVAVAAGYNHMAALKSDGTVVTWGSDTVFSPTGANTNLVPYNLAGVVAIAAGSNQTFAVKADGSVVWWGQGGSQGAYIVGGVPYSTPEGWGIAVPVTTPIAGTSAGFAFTRTYAGREATVYPATITPPTEPGDYSVTVVGTNSAFTTPKTYAFTIVKATPTITAVPSVGAINYGQNLTAATLSGGSASFGGNTIAGTFSFANGLLVPNAGTANQDVVFTPTNGSLFNPVVFSIPLVVNKVTPTLVNTPVATTITYGQTLASAVLGSGLATLPGTFAFTNPSTSPNAGIASNDVIFTPTDTTNYNTFITSIPVLVNRAMPTVITNPIAAAINYGQSLASSTLSGGVASLPGSFSFEDATIIPDVGSSSQNVVFIPTDTVNFSPMVVAVSVFARSFATANDSGIAGEAGGVANAVMGFDAIGNVFSNDPNYAGTSLTISAISNSVGSGTVGSALAGAYGSLTIQSNGDYVYTVANNNSTVDALQRNDSLS